jgi:hypothetical protein
MTEESRAGASGTADVFGSTTDRVYGDYDDEGMGVYNKPQHVQNRISSGRLPQPLAPPPTTIVSFSNPRCLPRITNPTMCADS